MAGVPPLSGRNRRQREVKIHQYERALNQKQQLQKFFSLMGTFLEYKYELLLYATAWMNLIK